MVGRGKYIHELYKHKVKPGRVNEYRKLVEEYYGNLAANKDYDMKLTGSWEVVVGELDTFCGAPLLNDKMQSTERLTVRSSVLPWISTDHVVSLLFVTPEFASLRRHAVGTQRLPWP